LFFIAPISVQAFELRTENIVTINKDEVIEGNLYTTASSLIIDGEIEGDVFCIAGSITINGDVSGDVICAGNTIDINGFIEGSVRVIGNSITINNSIDKNLQAIGLSINLEKEAEVGWDMFVAGEYAEVAGFVGGDLHGGIANILISGEVKKDIKLQLDNRKEKGVLNITSDALIGGNVFYTAGTKGTISEEAIIDGEIKHSFYKKEKADSNFWLFFGGLVSVFAALVVGLVLISIARKPIKKIISIIKNEVGPSFGFGSVAFFLTPIIVVLLIITIIGLPLAVILILLWAILLYLSKIIFGIFIGDYILKKYLKKKSKSLIWSMILGVVVLWFFSDLPFIGWIFCLMSILWGLGGILIFIKKNSTN